MHDVVRQFGGGNMFPAFYIFGKQIGMYGVCAVLGFLVSGFVGSKLARRRGISTEDLILVTLSAAIGLFIGGHILFGLTNFDKLIKLFGMIGSISFGSFLYCLGVIFGGSVFYGGLLGGIAAVSVYCRVSHSVDRTDMLDVMAVCVPLFHTFGRIGCFLGGCCYGLPCSFRLYRDRKSLQSRNLRCQPLSRSACRSGLQSDNFLCAALALTQTASARADDVRIFSDLSRRSLFA